MSEQRKAVIKNADMSDQMQQDAVDIASKALSEYSIEKVRHVEAFFYQYILNVCLSRHFICRILVVCHQFCFIQDVAAYIKKEFDRKHGPTWYGRCHSYCTNH